MSRAEGGAGDAPLKGLMVLRVRVFLGPSLSVEEGRRHLQADYRPPVRYADFEPAALAGVDVVGIIDAAFVYGYTATPTQILAALRRGVVVFGAASAGALRAVELQPFGMHGVGEIYRLFRSGEMDAEDELCVSYDPDTLRPLSLAMINVRHALALAVGQGIVSETTAGLLADAAKAMYFADRSWRGLFRAAEAWAPSEELAALRRFVEDDPVRIDLKRQDAVTCLTRIRSFVEQARSRQERSRRDVTPRPAGTPPRSPAEPSSRRGVPGPC